ncbi:MAG TPA: carbon-nitrogen hydrolase family protein [Candidatus Cybelea sp.]|nr:carbon-nitrogen hydrolase family protein [Candidatus Cybelea sp.]
MNRSLRVAAMQLRAHDRSDFPNALEHIVEETQRAAAQCDLLVLPEATFPAYVLGTADFDEAMVAGAIERLRDIAATNRTVIVAGAAARSDSGIRNGALVIDADGSHAGRADKVFLWHFDRRWFAPGRHIAPIECAAGKLGVLVCADGRLPTISRVLVDRGADLLVMPTAWVTSGRNPESLENVQADLLARVRAYENGVPFVAANKCGSELGMVAYCGKSQIVDARGEIVAIAGEHEPETISAAIEVGTERAPRAAPKRPPSRAPAYGGAMRVAISYDRLPDDVSERLTLLDDSVALSPHGVATAASTANEPPVPIVGDELVLDPAGLVAYRRAGYALIGWKTQHGAPWLERVARARALELRLYVVVFDTSAQRAFAVDPDGTIVAGTFGDYRLASFLFDPRKAADTLVAPSTDVVAGLEAVAEIAGDALRE